MKKMNVIISVFVCGGILLGIFSLGNLLGKPKKKSEKNYYETYAVLTRQTKYSSYEIFLPLGKKYIGSGVNYETWSVGMKFKALIDTNTKDYVILYDQPLFLKSEKTDITYGKVLRSYNSNMLNFFEYKFLVHDIEYRLIQLFPEGEKTQFMKSLHKGDSIKIEYLTKNPKFSRALLD